MQKNHSGVYSYHFLLRNLKHIYIKAFTFCLHKNQAKLCCRWQLFPALKMFICLEEPNKGVQLIPSGYIHQHREQQVI